MPDDIPYLFVCPLSPSTVVVKLKQLVAELTIHKKAFLTEESQNADYIIILPAFYDVYSSRHDINGELVTPLWLLHCARLSCILSSTGYNANPVLFLSGCIVSLKYISHETQSLYKGIIHHFGGRTIMKGACTICTHILYSSSLSCSPSSLSSGARNINSSIVRRTHPSTPLGNELLLPIESSHNVLSEDYIIYLCQLTIDELTEIDSLTLEANLISLATKDASHNRMLNVSRRWIISCIQNSRRVNEKDYLVPDDVSQLTPTTASESYAYTSQTLDHYLKKFQNLYACAGKCKPFLRDKKVFISPAFSKSVYPSLLQTITRLGGAIIPHVSAGRESNIDLVVTPDQISVETYNLPLQSLVSTTYLIDCIHFNALIQPDTIKHALPLSRRGISGMQNCVISITGFRDEGNKDQMKRQHVIELVRLCGACFTADLLRGINTHLVSSTEPSEKSGRALKWGKSIKVVTLEWLLCCWRSGTRVNESNHLYSGSKTEESKSKHLIDLSYAQDIISSVKTSATIIKRTSSRKRLDSITTPNIDFQYDVGSQLSPGLNESNIEVDDNLTRMTDTFDVTETPVSSTRKLRSSSKRKALPLSNSSIDNFERFELGNVADKVDECSQGTTVVAQSSIMLLSSHRKILHAENSFFGMNKDNSVVDSVSDKKGKHATEDIVPNQINSEVALDKTYIFQLSGLDASQEELLVIIATLGGTALGIEGDSLDRRSFQPSCTHVVIGDPLKRTEKFLCACASGKWILHQDYLIDSMKAGLFLPEDLYEWGNPARPCQMNMVQSIWSGSIKKHRTALNRPFVGLVAYIHLSDDSNEVAKYHLLRNLIEAGGGVIAGDKVEGSLSIKIIQSFSMRPNIIIGTSNASAKRMITKFCEFNEILMISDIAFMDTVSTENGMRILATAVTPINYEVELRAPDFCGNIVTNPQSNISSLDSFGLTNNVIYNQPGERDLITEHSPKRRKSRR